MNAHFGVGCRNEIKLTRVGLDQRERLLSKGVLYSCEKFCHSCDATPTADSCYFFFGFVLVDALGMALAALGSLMPPLVTLAIEGSNANGSSDLLDRS